MQARGWAKAVQQAGSESAALQRPHAALQTVGTLRMRRIFAAMRPLPQPRPLEKGMAAKTAREAALQKTFEELLADTSLSEDYTSRPVGSLLAKIAAAKAAREAAKAPRCRQPVEQVWALGPLSWCHRICYTGYTRPSLAPLSKCRPGVAPRSSASAASSSAAPASVPLSPSLVAGLLQSAPDGGTQAGIPRQVLVSVGEPGLSGSYELESETARAAERPAQEPQEPLAFQGFWEMPQLLREAEIKAAMRDPNVTIPQMKAELKAALMQRALLELAEIGLNLRDFYSPELDKCIFQCVGAPLHTLHCPAHCHHRTPQHQYVSPSRLRSQDEELGAESRRALAVGQGGSDRRTRDGAHRAGACTEGLQVQAARLPFPSLDRHAGRGCARIPGALRQPHTLAQASPPRPTLPEALAPMPSPPHTHPSP